MSNNSPEYHRAYRAKKKAEGFCSRCAIRPALEGQSTCEDCQKYNHGRENNQEWQRKRRDSQVKKGLCIKCNNPLVPGKRHCQRHLDLERARRLEKLKEPGKREEERVQSKARALRVKLQVFAAYGGACACCGERTPEFLTFDHVSGGGNERRRNGEPIGVHMAYKLRREGFPAEYQLLCWNCNSAKGLYGQCPHQR